MNKLNTYWVEYSWNYEYFDNDDLIWLHDFESDSCRIKCRKKDIKKEVEKRVMEEMELSGDKYKNLEINIDDYYITTEFDV